MSLDLETVRRAAQRRAVTIGMASAAPLALALVLLAQRLVGSAPAWGLGLLVLLLTLIGCLVRARRFDSTWLACRLDARCPELEDSSALLLGPAPEGTLAGLQRVRLRQRIADLGPLDLRPAWPLRRLLALWTLALAFGAGAVFVPAMHLSEQTTPGASTAPAEVRRVSALTHVSLKIAPPAYTGLPVRREAALDAKIPDGSRLGFQLGFDAEPRAVHLVFHDGSRLALQREGTFWRGERLLTTPLLYRIELDGVPPLAGERLHRLDLIPDRPPEVRVGQPDKTLNLLDTGQREWLLAFEANDDYGLGEARLSVTLAQGTGENITLKEQSLVLQGVGEGRQKQYRQSLDLGQLGYAQGDDLILRLSVADNRTPKPNTARSASFILRWPPGASEDSAGMDGLARQTLPAYFRSQRQIIIDSEALLAERPRRAEEAFLARADELGVDQKILRLRYGQFLGEEFESGAAEGAEHAGDEHEGDEHGSEETAQDFGTAGDVLAEFGHTHDQAEAATLLDPETKALLKAALAQMWQAELKLRLGQPDLALPYEYKALEHIKQVQQSTRIYLARVGLELPPVDPARRMSGERGGLHDRPLAVAAARSEDQAVPALWLALSQERRPDWVGFEAWLAKNEARLPDALGLRAELDGLRREPACAPCRERLKALLWPLLPAAAPRVEARRAPDTLGEAYLDALGESLP